MTSFAVNHPTASTSNVAPDPPFDSDRAAAATVAQLLNPNLDADGDYAIDASAFAPRAGLYDVYNEATFVDDRQACEWVDAHSIVANLHGHRYVWFEPKTSSLTFIILSSAPSSSGSLNDVVNS